MPTIKIDPIKLGKTQMVRATMRASGKTFKAYCTKGQYAYNETASELGLLTQLWGLAAEELGSKFTDQFCDSAELARLIGGADRSAMMTATR